MNSKSVAVFMQKRPIKTTGTNADIELFDPYLGHGEILSSASIIGLDEDISVTRLIRRTGKATKQILAVEHEIKYKDKLIRNLKLENAEMKKLIEKAGYENMKINKVNEDLRKSYLLHNLKLISRNV